MPRPAASGRPAAAPLPTVGGVVVVAVAVAADAAAGDGPPAVTGVLGAATAAVIPDAFSPASSRLRNAPSPAPATLRIMADVALRMENAVLLTMDAVAVAPLIPCHFWKIPITAWLRPKMNWMKYGTW